EVPIYIQKSKIRRTRHTGRTSRNRFEIVLSITYGWCGRKIQFRFLKSKLNSSVYLNRFQMPNRTPEPAYLSHYASLRRAAAMSIDNRALSKTSAREIGTGKPARNDFMNAAAQAI